MQPRFNFILEDSWPALAWIARCERPASVIDVRHGPQVEISADWLCEAVWDGEFASGDFDRTDLVFGSGARLRDGRAVFVSSGTTVDRLQFLELGDTTWVSNSLACLLGVSGVKVDPTYDRYFDFFWSLTRGLDGYERRVPTSTGRLEIVFFRNLTWDGEELSEEEKPAPTRKLDSFEEYRAFLDTSLAAIAANMQSAERGHRYGMVSGISSGYDSTTVTVLARKAGLERAFSFRRARGGDEDHGEEIARQLGIELTLVGRTDWRDQPFSEIPYLAVNGAGQDIVFSSARELLRGQVLISGFHGDRIWDNDDNDLGPDFVRSSDGGLAFTEHRLQLGCIHFPVPFLGARQIREVKAIGSSSDLAAWDIPGDYSRPICRRIVEDAGIPRDAFGMNKKAVTNHFRRGEAVLTEESREAYYGWLRTHERLWRKGRAKVPQVPGRAFWAFYTRYTRTWRAMHANPRILPGRISEWVDRAGYKYYRRLNRRINLVEHLFPWAVERLAQVYSADEEARS